MNRLFALLFIFSIVLFLSCEDSEGPNELSGKTDIALSEPGSEFGVYISMDGVDDSPFDAITDDVTVTTRDGGIVTFHAEFTIDETNLKKIDTLLGTQDAGESIKRQVVDHYLDMFGAEIDTTDKQNMSLNIDFKGKITENGIQDFLFSGGDESKPFTLVKYDAKVGDKYKFTTEEGVEIVREVTEKSNEDTYPLGFLYIKVMTIEQNSDDPLVDKIVYYANHKFGLVGVEVRMINGNVVSTTIIPWNVVD